MVGQRLRQHLDGALDQHGVIGRLAGAALGQRAFDHHHVEHILRRQPGLRLGGHAGVFLDRDHGFGDAGDHGGRIAVAAADVQHQIVGLQVQDLHHLALGARFQQHAARGQIQVFAGIGDIATRVGDELLARDGQHGVDDGIAGHVVGADLGVDHHGAALREIAHYANPALGWLHALLP